MLDSILNLIPRPTPIRVAAVPDGVLYVWELTLNDLAELQSMLDASWVDPAVGLESSLPDDAEGRRVALADAWRASEAKPVFGQPSGREWTQSREGVAALLWVACRRTHKDWTPAKAADYVGLLTADEIGAAWRAAYGHSSADEILRLMEFGDKPKAGKGKATWGELVDEVCRSHKGWTYQDVYQLTMTEFLNARALGKPREVGVRLPMDSAAIKKARDGQLRRMYGGAATGEQQANG